MRTAVVLIAVLSVAGCKGSKPKPADGKGTEPPLPTMPKTHVDARDILGKPEAQARAAFGADGDRRTIDGVELDLVVDTGVAVELGVHMPDARARRDDITRWLELGDQYWFTLAGVRYAVDTRADDHVRIVDEERAMRLDPQYPARVRQTFAEVMAEGASATTGLHITARATGPDGHVLEFTIPACDTVILQQLQADPTMHEQLRRADFRRLECTNGSTRAALELAGPAVLRREFAADFQRSFAEAGKPEVRVTAEGADAAVLRVHWSDCTTEALGALIGNIKPMLAEQGFARIECAGGTAPGAVDL